MPEEKRELSWNIFFWEAVLFILTSVLGILTAVRVSESFKIENIEIPNISFQNFIFSFAIATAFIFLLSRILKYSRGRDVIFRLLFVFSVFLGGTLLLASWIWDLAALALSLIIILWWLKKPSVFNHDILMILGIAGSGSILGLSLTPQVIIWLLVILSVYDIIAVYKTRHMVEIAKAMIQSKAALAFIIPPNFLGFSEGLEKIKPGEKFLILGGGDVALPLLLSVSLIPQGIASSLAVSAFSLFGLLAGFLIFMTRKIYRPLPALPPIAFFSIIGYLVVSYLMR